LPCRHRRRARCLGHGRRRPASARSRKDVTAVAPIIRAGCRLMAGNCHSLMAGESEYSLRNRGSSIYDRAAQPVDPARRYRGGTACPHWVSESFLSKRGRAVPRPCSRALNQACVSILLILRAAMIIMDAMTTTPESALMYRL
jgi:hypothetical protein